MYSPARIIKKATVNEKMSLKLLNIMKDPIISPNAKAISMANFMNFSTFNLVRQAGQMILAGVRASRNRKKQMVL